jgi:hypothetical protein
LTIITHLLQQSLRQNANQGKRAEEIADSLSALNARQQAVEQDHDASVRSILSFHSAC